MTVGTEILIIFTSVAATVALLSSLLMFIHPRKNDNARFFLGNMCVVAASIWFIRVFTMARGIDLPGAVLPIETLHKGFFFMLLFVLYPIEVKRPNWLNFKRILLIFTPWLCYSAAIVLFKDNYVPLDSFASIWANIDNPNVAFRLSYIIIQPICITLPFIFQRSTSDVNPGTFWLKFYIYGLIVFVAISSLYLLTGLVSANILLMIYAAVFFTLVSFQELFLRIASPLASSHNRDDSSVNHEIKIDDDNAVIVVATGEEAKSETNIKDNIYEITPIKSKESTAAINDNGKTDALWVQLCDIVDNEKLWRNPDLDTETLVDRMKINRNRLRQIIKSGGYNGYVDFIQSRRVADFANIVDSVESKADVQAALFTAGFRSKTTAIRIFREYVGMTPSEYARHIKAL